MDHVTQWLFTIKGMSHLLCVPGRVPLGVFFRLDGNLYPPFGLFFNLALLSFKSLIKQGYIEGATQNLGLSMVGKFVKHKS